MVSAVRKNKLNYVFDTFFDINRDGSIEKSDFELAVEQIAKIRGYAAGDAKYKDTSDRFLEIWDKLRASADTNRDDKVSREEWQALWTIAPLDDEWKKLYMNFMFRLQDTSGDGTIDIEEFTSVCTSFGVPEAEIKTSFDKISNGGKTNIDIGVYQGLWKDYFTSDDAAAPGNSIFGKSSFA
jgi:Ca2+-binding EF-hand superfamily protein